MTNIINFPVPEREHVSYSATKGTGMAVMDAELKAIIGFDGDDPDNVFIAVNGEGIDTDRKRLAEFLWCAVYMIDSEQRFIFDELPARNYE